MRNVAVLPPVKNELRAALLNLTAFKNLTTQDLIAMARAVPGGTKVHIPVFAPGWFLQRSRRLDEMLQKKYVEIRRQRLST